MNLPKTYLQKYLLKDIAWTGAIQPSRSILDFDSSFVLVDDPINDRQVLTAAGGGPLIWINKTTTDTNITSSSITAPTDLCAINLTVPQSGMVAIVTYGIAGFEAEGPTQSLGVYLGDLFASLLVDTNVLQDSPGYSLHATGTGEQPFSLQRSFVVPVTAGFHRFDLGAWINAKNSHATFTVVDAAGAYGSAHGAHLIVELVVPQVG